MSRSLKVVYDGPLDRELDERIEEAVNPLGWKRWASGFNRLDGKRDLAFDLIEGEEDGN